MSGNYFSCNNDQGTSQFVRAVCTYAKPNAHKIDGVFFMLNEQEIKKGRKSFFFPVSLLNGCN